MLFLLENRPKTLIRFLNISRILEQWLTGFKYTQVNPSSKFSHNIILTFRATYTDVYFIDILC